MWLTQRVFLASLFFIFLSVFVLPPLSAHSATLYVGLGEEHQTIQAGIDAAVAGDTVIVRDGRYSGEGNMAVTFKGKAITVRSENGLERCIIEGTNQDENGFIFKSGEGTRSILSGFTIRNFSTAIFCQESSPAINNCRISGNGGTGIYCKSSSPPISNCTISGNDGGGFFCIDSSPPISNCKISGNGGTGIYCESSSPPISNCTISGNRRYGIYCEYFSSAISNCTISGNGLTGIYCEHSSPLISNCTISGNRRCGIYGTDSSSLTITNTIIWENVVKEITVSPEDKALVTYSCIEGGYPGEGNIADDPLFFRFSSGVFHLKPESPCIDAGNPDTSDLPAADKDGNPRVVGDRVDMGAYEYCPTCLPTVAVGRVDRNAAEEGLDPGKIVAFRVNGDVNVRVPVVYHTQGTAENGVDYQPLPGKIAIPAGRYHANIDIIPLEDDLPEGTEKTSVFLHERKAYILSQPYHAGVRILDNDQP